jgi:hypothetical protein
VHVLVTHADPFPVQEESQALQFAWSNVVTFDPW